MADFCHDWEPGGFGCGGSSSTCETRPEGECFGDFNAIVDQTLAEGEHSRLLPGWYITVGICEGHGATVRVSRDEDDGKLYFEHVALSPESLQPPRRLIARAWEGP